MQRDRLTFNQFKGIFADNVGKGYMPVYAYTPDEEEDEVDVVYIDLICEYRIPDGKVKFLAVQFENNEQFNEIVAYLETSADGLRDKILANVNSLAAKRKGK